MQLAPLKLLSSMATRDVVSELAAQYQKATSRPVAAEAAGGVDVAKRVMSGEEIDVVILAANAIDKLASEHKLLPGSRVDLVRLGIGVAVAADSAIPDISSEEAVKQAVLAAPSLSYSTGPSGVYLEKVFRRWGIFESIRDRIVVPPPGIPVGSLVANGRAAVGFQQLSELVNCPGVMLVGALPPALQNITIFSGAVSSGCRERVAAGGLLEFMASPGVADVKMRHGMEPA
jgi:molybdate transport system substrate-binding protein